MKITSFLFFIIVTAIAFLAAYYAAVQGSEASGIFTRFLGLIAFMLLCTTLLIGPLALLNPNLFGHLIEMRRAIGISTFIFVLTHLLLAASFYFNWDIAIMLKFLPIDLGVAAAFILFILAATSSDYALRKLGRWWKIIQQFNYLAFIFAFAHFAFQAKVFSGTGQQNIAELSMLGLGILVILIQLAAFAVRKKK